MTDWICVCGHSWNNHDNYGCEICTCERDWNQEEDWKEIGE